MVLGRTTWTAFSLMAVCSSLVWTQLLPKDEAIVITTNDNNGTGVVEIAAVPETDDVTDREYSTTTTPTTGSSEKDGTDTFSASNNDAISGTTETLNNTGSLTSSSTVPSIVGETSVMPASKAATEVTATRGFLYTNDTAYSPTSSPTFILSSTTSGTDVSDHCELCNFNGACSQDNQQCLCFSGFFGKLILLKLLYFSVCVILMLTTSASLVRSNTVRECSTMNTYEIVDFEKQRKTSGVLFNLCVFSKLHVRLIKKNVIFSCTLVKFS